MREGRSMRLFDAKPEDRRVVTDASRAEYQAGR